MKEINLNIYKGKTPTINLTVQRVEASVWHSLGFHKYHYMSAKINPSCKCLLFCWNEVPVAFVGLINQPNKGHPWGFRISRIVILPDFQGLGLSSRILDFCGGIIKNYNDKAELYLKTIHDKMGKFLEKSNNWQPTTFNGKERKKRNDEGTKYSNRLVRKSYCYKYSGNKLLGYEDLLLPVKDLRNSNIC